MSLLAITVTAIALGYGALLMLALCRVAKRGDEAQVVRDNYRNHRPILVVPSQRCPVCGDPTGVRCCEFGRDS